MMTLLFFALVFEVVGHLRRTESDPEVHDLCIHQVCVNTPSHSRKENMVEEIIGTHAAMNRMKFSSPHYVDVANVSEADQDRMRKVGIIVTDRTNMTDHFKDMWHPEHRLDHAQLRGLHITGAKGVPLDVQERKDGWATYFKFLAWKLLQCKKVLLFDADMHFSEKVMKNGTLAERSGREIEESIMSGPADEFSAHHEICGYHEFSDHFETFVRQKKGCEISSRGYDGLNSRVMLLTPSQRVYDLFTDTASNGSFVPYTQCEQDVIESLVIEGKFKVTSDRVKTVPLIHKKASRPDPWIRQTRAIQPAGAKEDIVSKIGDHGGIK